MAAMLAAAARHPAPLRFAHLHPPPPLAPPRQRCPPPPLSARHLPCLHPPLPLPRLHRRRLPLHLRCHPLPSSLPPPLPPLLPRPHRPLHCPSAPKLPPPHLQPLSALIPASNRAQTSTHSLARKRQPPHRHPPLNPVRPCPAPSPGQVTLKSIPRVSRTMGPTHSAAAMTIQTRCPSCCQPCWAVRR